MKLYILDYGTIEIDQGFVVAMANPANIDNKNPVAVWMTLPIYGVLIEHPQGRLLYDLGCHPDAMKDRWPEHWQKLAPCYQREENYPVAQLKKLGLSPKDIDLVIVSHLHLDHTGDLEPFRHAPIYVHQTDFQMALVSTHKSPDPLDWGAYIRADVEFSCYFTLVSEDMELWEGIELITLEGHTPGILGMLVKLKNAGNIIFPSDAIYTAMNYGPPPKPPGIIYDTLGFFRTIEKVQKLAKMHNAQIFFPHDPGQFKEFRKAPEYYD
jgi:glyoxylase-like metal-dependent hydrolase (beta-lactamase superfamily II)